MLDSRRRCSCVAGKMLAFEIHKVTRGVRKRGRFRACPEHLLTQAKEGPYGTVVKVVYVSSSAEVVKL